MRTGTALERVEIGFDLLLFDCAGEDGHEDPRCTKATETLHGGQARKQEKHSEPQAKSRKP